MEINRVAFYGNQNEFCIGLLQYLIHAGFPENMNNYKLSLFHLKWSKRHSLVP